MNIHRAKNIVLTYFMYQKSHIGAFTESLQRSDVLVVNRNHYTTEIEIKTKREDLLNELHTIALAMDKNNGGRLRQRTVKYTKHCHYLGIMSPINEEFVPNNFYIAVPEDLYDHRLNALPSQYGIMVLKNDLVQIVRRPQKLHNNKIDIKYVWRLVTRASHENINLRLKFLRGGEEHE